MSVRRRDLPPQHRRYLGLPPDAWLMFAIVALILIVVIW